MSNNSPLHRQLLDMLQINSVLTLTRASTDTRLWAKSQKTDSTAESNHYPQLLSWLQIESSHTPRQSFDDLLELTDSGESFIET